ncbi:uncharacterized protein LOC62_01G001554 [Vanrija pseudolonga]|uniref:BTB domain-containing protein n=1 Tax=Vanrija pseudolonga TaxID=143232 RepID=A0AAF0Y263_9TREE|nr:hypothetical protein LOC62_01G001554 [Vanrija pseudolonga]
MPPLPSPSSSSAPAPILLISADGESFTIEAFHLLAASAQFRAQASAQDLASTPPIHFFDPAIESAPTLRLFLQLITAGSLSLPLPSGSLEPDTHLHALNALVHFLIKWGCGPALSTLTLHLGAELRAHRLAPLSAFVLASTAKDLELALSALKERRDKDVRWPKGSKKERWVAAKAGARGLDAKSLPLDVWRLIRPSYVWALVRASGEADWDEKGFDRAFEEFVRAADDAEGR